MKKGRANIETTEIKLCHVCGKSIFKPEPTWIVCKACYFRGVKKVPDDYDDKEG